MTTRMPASNPHALAGNLPTRPMALYKYAMRFRLLFVSALGVMWASSLVAQPEPSAAPPTFAGKGKVTEAINTDTGAVFDIGSGLTMTFPRGLPVGRSRLVTLRRVKSLPGKLIPGFKALGFPVEFNGALNTADSPITVAMASPRNPAQRGMKLILAMEVGTFCDASNRAHPLKAGLCSGFELQDAEYDASRTRMVAQLKSTGGLRMQFGLVPLPK
jgi:hypothetical protein